jgi:hypothetical protein
MEKVIAPDHNVGALRYSQRPAFATFAAFYYLVSRRARFLVDHAVVGGLLYGLGIYLVMYGLVLRFSAIHSTVYPWAYPWTVLICNVLIHMLGIGLPIALTVRHYSK